MQESKGVIERIPNTVICLGYQVSEVKKRKLKGMLASEFTGSSRPGQQIWI